jgi:hypothetical protein
MSSAKTLVDLIREKTGVSAEQAQQAIDVVVGFLKEKLPEPIAAQVDTVLKVMSVRLPIRSMPPKRC